MDGFPAFWTVPLGMMAGALCVGLVTRWLMLCTVAWGAGAKEGGASAGRSGAIVVLILHPTTWLLLAGLPLGVYRLFSQPPGAPWCWFYASAALTFAAIFLVSFYLARKRSAEKRNG